MGVTTKVGRLTHGFTLVELMIVMSILVILAGLTVAALRGAVNEARAARTRAIIKKLDQLISERWEEYRTRAVPVRLPAGTHGLVAGRVRLYALRELMRMEMPDRITDVTDGPVVLAVTNIPSLTQSYRRLVNRATNNAPANWTRQFQGSECLYMIVATMKDGDKSALDYFTSDEVGDVDGDGMKEILDGWGQPIEFLRWAPGYCELPGPNGVWGQVGDDDASGTAEDIFEAGYTGSDDIVPLTLQTRIGSKNPNNPDQPFAPDPYDPLRIDQRICRHALASYPPNSMTPVIAATVGDIDPSNDTYALWPLIFSAGPDKSYDVATIMDENGNASTPFRYSQTANYPTANTRPPNDPYFIPPAAWGTQVPFGTVGDIDGDGNARGWADNITNHYTETP
jgi:prepilin-type N-terminal cleavage/methylation domain-containing protein